MHTMDVLALVFYEAEELIPCLSLGKECIMARRIDRGVWQRSLIAAFVLYALFQLLSSSYSTLSLSTITDDSNIPSVTFSLVVSEVANILSEIVHDWPWGIFQTGVALLVYSIVGYVTTRQAGSIKAGMRAGVLAGLFYGLLIGINTVKLYLLSRPTLSGNVSDPALAQLMAYTYAQVLIDTLFSALFSLLYYGLLASFGGGFLGGYYASRFSERSQKTAWQSQEAQHVEEEQRE
jgi:hypothetical protein